MANKQIRKTKVPRTRNAGTMTEAMFWGRLRSHIRKAFQYWKPMTIALENASRPYNGPNTKQKKEYQCADCKNWFKRTDVQIDHIVPCGSLKSFDDIEGFITRLTQEDPKAYAILCKEDHQKKTNHERLNRD